MRTIALLLLLAATLQAQIALEAEDATLKGTSIATNIAGFSGDGYVYLENAGSISFPISVPQSGFYKLVIRANTSLGNKNQKLFVNGEFVSSLIFPQNSSWFNFDAGSISLNAGSNTIEIQPDWGYMYFDKITLTEEPPHDYSKVTALPIDPLADSATKAVYQYLRSQYGKTTLAGQTSYWNELIALAGKTPVVRCFDMQNYSEHNPWHDDWSSWDDGTVQEAINWHKSTNGKGIVSFQWHWFSPMGGSLRTSIFYTDQTNFDVSRAVQSGTAENQATLRDIDSIAVQLQRLEDAGVPVLWRPLHEAGGAWFWWGAKGAASAKALYDIMYNRLTNVHGLHNLIWVWSTPEIDWYPGNNKVDIIGYDSYPGEFVYTPQKGVFDQLFAMVEGKKMVAMTENGPIPDVDALVKNDAMWLYFSSWGDMVTSQNSNTHIQGTYAHSKVITLDEVVYSQNPTGLKSNYHARLFNPQDVSQFDLKGRKRTLQNP